MVKSRCQTCSFTRLPIFYGDNVLAVRLNKEVKSYYTFDLLALIEENVNITEKVGVGEFDGREWIIGEEEEIKDSDNCCLDHTFYIHYYIVDNLFPASSNIAEEVVRWAYLARIELLVGDFEDKANLKDLDRYYQLLELTNDLINEKKLCLMYDG